MLNEANKNMYGGMGGQGGVMGDVEGLDREIGERGGSKCELQYAEMLSDKSDSSRERLTVLGLGLG